MEFKLATADLGNGVSTVSVAGEVDLNRTGAEGGADRGRVATARKASWSTSPATFIDSTTLRPDGRGEAPATGGRRVGDCRATHRRIFEITLLDRVFQIFDTPGAGVEHLQGVGAAAASDLSPRG